MKKILVLGAGRSSGSLIAYLLDASAKHNWFVTVADADLNLASAKIANHPNGSAAQFNVYDEHSLSSLIQEHELIISLMPAALHILVARLCLVYTKHLFTASYVSAEMLAMHDEVKNKDLLFLNECGLDPGIDHMTAMELLDVIRKEGGIVNSFESFTGGLLAPETDPGNPWRYKFTWNPRNVVMAGYGTAKFLEDGIIRYVPYQQLFTRTTRVKVPGIDLLDGYPNRDSLQYLSVYNLQEVKTMIRGTLRFTGYCEAWYILSQLGVCDESYEISLHDKTFHDFTSSFLPAGKIKAEEKLKNMFPNHINGISLLQWSGFFADELFDVHQATPAKAVEIILSKRWTLKPEDKDLIVMWHRIGYTLGNESKKIEAALTVKGKNAEQTAMADTVGLPLAIATELFLTGEISEKGVIIPISRKLYQPILAALEKQGIKMQILY